MYITQLDQCIRVLFGELLDQFKDQDEFGYNHIHSRSINRIGYCTNLTPDIIEQAHFKNIDMIITHHDAWDFVYGMKQDCVNLLQMYDIGHFYVHLPLDYAEFGTCNSLFREIGDVSIIQQSQHVHDDSIIGVGDLTTPISFDSLVQRLTTILDEDIKSWQFGSKQITRVGILTGAGNLTSYVNQALLLNCDVYITGEKSLYTVQYAKHVGINLIVGSHTFTEIFGVKSFTDKIKEQFPDVELIYLEEEHLE